MKASEIELGMRVKQRKRHCGQSHIISKDEMHRGVVVGKVDVQVHGSSSGRGIAKVDVEFDDGRTRNVAINTLYREKNDA